jgi:hypothetical protein
MPLRPLPGSAKVFGAGYSVEAHCGRESLRSGIWEDASKRARTTGSKKARALRRPARVYLSHRLTIPRHSFRAPSIASEGADKEAPSTGGAGGRDFSGHYSEGFEFPERGLGRITGLYDLLTIADGTIMLQRTIFSCLLHEKPRHHWKCRGKC